METEEGVELDGFDRMDLKKYDGSSTLEKSKSMHPLICMKDGLNIQTLAIINLLMINILFFSCIYRVFVDVN